MTKNQTFSVKARVTSRTNASAYLKQPGDAVIVDRQGPRWLVLSCPCGCGAEVPVNLDRRAGPAWRMYESPKGTSIYPSVWRDTDCKSHFIIWRDKIHMIGAQYGASWTGELREDEDNLLQRVLEVLSDREQSAQEISDQIPCSEPWDVWRCCRRLCLLGKAIEGSGFAEGRFRRG
jgi:Family of unknown function (DUF6527)